MTVASTVRELVADAAGDPAAARAPDPTPLLAGGLGLDSVAVVRLLAGITRTLGVDVADLDLDLASLATLGTLVAFVTEHRDGAADG